MHNLTRLCRHVIIFMNMNGIFDHGSGSPSVLIAFCADQDGTGKVYAFDGQNMMKIDEINSSGAATRPGRLVRLLWSHSRGDVWALGDRPAFVLVVEREQEAHVD